MICHWRIIKVKILVPSEHTINISFFLQFYFIIKIERQNVSHICVAEGEGPHLPNTLSSCLDPPLPMPTDLTGLHAAILSATS